MDMKSPPTGGLFLCANKKPATTAGFSLKVSINAI